MLLDTTTDTAVVKCESIFDMIEAVRPEVVRKHLQDCHDKTDGSDESCKFIGRRLNGWDAVYDAMQQPWQDGIDTIDKMLQQIGEATMPTPKCRKRKVRFREDDGDELDHDRMRSGQSYWRSSRRESHKGPSTITIMVDVSTNGFRPASEILWRGATAVAVAKILEDAGYRVELWAYDKGRFAYPAGSKQRHSFVAVCLKRTGDPFDVVALVNAVSGWAYRTLWFRAVAIHGPVEDGLGSASVPDEKELDSISPDARKVVITNVWSLPAAIDGVRKAIRDLFQQAVA